MKTSFAASAIWLGSALLCSSPALASEPATHEVAVPSPGNTVTVEWTGEALPGATAGPGTVNDLGASLGGAPSVIGCPPTGPDDSHGVTITVPEGFYEAGNSVTADFRIEWEAGESTAGVFTDPDLGFSVYEGTVNLMGYSDGGEPSETVGVTNPAAGTYTAIVCPFTSSEVTPYRGRLTLTTLEPKACLVDHARTVPNGLGSSVGGNADISGLPDFDTFFAETRGLAYGVPTHDSGRHQSTVYDRSLGLPTFLWARSDAQTPAVGALTERELLIERARAHLRDEAKPLRLTAQAIDEARVFDAQFNGDGPAVVRFRQQVDGIEVFQRALNVLLDREHRPVAVSGYFAPRAQPLGAFATGAPAAIAASWATLGGSLDPAALALADTRGAWQRYESPALEGSHELQREPRARQIWYARNGGLEPAWQIELFADAKSNGQLIAYSFVVSARNNAVLHRDNLKHEAAYSYRVFADKNGPLHQPYDSPVGNGYVPFPGLIVRKGAGAELVTLEHAGIRTGDPWLAGDATTTDGNNVRACIDSYDHPADSLVNFGEIGGIRQNDCLAPLEPGPALTSERTFDYPIEADEDPAHQNAKDAAAVNLFYMINWMHDWWYNHGFDEAAGNAQAGNFGRGGEEGDPILAQGQDGSGSNNANMATPADGSSPVMQQYLFDGKAPKGDVRTVSPAGDPIYWVGAAFGPQEYDLEPTAVALADAGVGEPGDGCGEPVPVIDEALAAVHENDPGTPLPGPLTYQPVPAPPQTSLAGKIALIDRGNCNSGAKAKFAIASGAVAMIVVNNSDSPPTIMTSDQPIYATAVGPRAAHDAAYNVPAVMIPKADGERIKGLLGSGEVTMSMSRQPTVKLDGTMDNTIIAHEFFHYVHHRLTDSSSPQTDAMSEGWGDINGFMVSLRDEDVNVAGNDKFQGAYSVAGYVYNDFYKGIRRNPYTTDFELNPFTFQEIQNDTEAHGAGEVWAEMVYECYAGILNGPGSYAQSRSRMQDYIVAGLKMTPANATYTEARDAVMAAALATDFGDYARCGAGFARRGIGLKAVAPARSSSAFEGLVEDYTPFVCGQGDGKTGLTPGESSSPVMGGVGLFFLLPLIGAATLRRRRGTAKQ
jgi:hypothetical protein